MVVLGNSCLILKLALFCSIGDLFSFRYICCLQSFTEFRLFNSKLIMKTESISVPAGLTVNYPFIYNFPFCLIFSEISSWCKYWDHELQLQPGPDIRDMSAHPANGQWWAVTGEILSKLLSWEDTSNCFNIMLMLIQLDRTMRERVSSHKNSSARSCCTTRAARAWADLPAKTLADKA